LELSGVFNFPIRRNRDIFPIAHDPLTVGIGDLSISIRDGETHLSHLLNKFNVAVKFVFKGDFAEETVGLISVGTGHNFPRSFNFLYIY